MFLYRCATRVYYYTTFSLQKFKDSIFFADKRRKVHCAPRRSCKKQVQNYEIELKKTFFEGD